MSPLVVVLWVVSVHLRADPKTQQSGSRHQYRAAQYRFGRDCLAVLEALNIAAPANPVRSPISPRDRFFCSLKLRNLWPMTMLAPLFELRPSTKSALAHCSPASMLGFGSAPSLLHYSVDVRTVASERSPCVVSSLPNSPRPITNRHLGLLLR